jgi:hypothetical protein
MAVEVVTALAQAIGTDTESKEAEIALSALVLVIAV